jgi:hypothetical protein
VDNFSRTNFFELFTIISWVHCGPYSHVSPKTPTHSPPLPMSISWLLTDRLILPETISIRIGLYKPSSTLHRKFETNISINETARPRSQFLHSCICERSIYSHDRSAYCVCGQTMHCNENPTYVFLFWEFRGLSPNFHIHVSVSNLYFPRIGPHIPAAE